MSVTAGLKYGVLDATNEKMMQQAAQVLAETFVGVQVGEATIKEPMIVTSGLSTETWGAFVLDYLKAYAAAGLCMVAIEEETGDVMGVVACDSFDPGEDLPEFTGEFAPLTDVLDFVVDLDHRFVERFEEKTGEPVKKDEFVHLFLIGIRAEKNKKHIGADLTNLLIDIATKKGYKGIFLEATNYRSQRVFGELCGFYVPNGTDGQPIVNFYKDSEVFRVIPEDIAIDCQLMYKPLAPEFVI